MNPFLKFNINTPEDLLDYFSGLVENGQEPCPLPMEICLAARHVLEEEEERRKISDLRLRNMEQEKAETEEKYRRMLSFTIDLVGESDPADAAHVRENTAVGLMASVKQFKGALERSSEPELVDTSFTRLKDAVLKETRGNSRKIDRIRLLGLMGRWLRPLGGDKTPDERFIDLFVLCKESYQDIVLELERVLSARHRRTVRQVDERIGAAQTMDDFHGIRGQILSLLQEYIAESANDRVQAVSFAEDVSKKILEMDRNLAAYMESFQDIQMQNRRFNKELSASIQSLRKSLTISTSIKELNLVLDKKISLISGMLNRKKAREYSQEQRLKKQVETLKAGMRKIRGGLARARQQNQWLESELNTDLLTGVGNRRAYERNASKEMLRFMRYRRVFSLIVFDVDRFKGINDTYGHAIGDKCLKEVIARIQPGLRQTDILARTGGDEFVIIMPETGKADAEGVADKIRRLVEQTEFVYKNEAFHMSLSLGVAEAREIDESYESIFIRADKALYMAKQQGRNRVGVLAAG